MDDKRERGMEFFGRVLGRDMSSGLREHAKSNEFGKEHGAWAADFAFGTVWSREGLDPKMRSCVVLGILMGLRQEEEIKYHVRIALANGLTKDEIQEVLYMSIPYAGFPAAGVARRAMIEALEEIEQEKAA